MNRFIQRNFPRIAHYLHICAGNNKQGIHCRQCFWRERDAWFRDLEKSQGVSR